jgi:hypothetical protein
MLVVKNQKRETGKETQDKNLRKSTEMKKQRERRMERW